jgi:hypothetical protein
MYLDHTYRRITIDSTCQSVAVTPFARWVNMVGLSAKVAPGPPGSRPFQATNLGATALQVNRALYGRNKGSCGAKMMIGTKRKRKSAKQMRRG